MHSEASRKRPNGIDIVSVINSTTPENLKRRKTTTENGELTSSVPELSIDALTTNNALPHDDALVELQEPVEDSVNTSKEYDDVEESNEDSLEDSHVRGTAGIIRKVYMRNFMCHQSYEVELYPSVNVIQGPNGSGKSAVIAAIQVALGSRAFATERAHSLSDLIFQGANYALIKVRIVNKAPAEQQNLFDNRYRPDLFKDAIVIQRRIPRNGASEWTLFDAENKKVDVPNARQEVERITRHFHIYIDNPATVVPQQKWKQLLHSKKAEELYEFFAEATGLRNYEQNLNNARNSCLQAQIARQQKQEMLPSLQKEVEELETERGSLENVEQMQLELKEVEREYAWRLVFEKKKTLNEEIQEEADARSRQEQVQNEIQRVDNEITSLNNQIDEGGARMEELLQETEAWRSEVEATRNELSQKKRWKQEHESELETLKHEVERITGMLDECQRRLNNDNTLESQQMNSISSQINSLELEKESLNETNKNYCDSIARNNRELEELEKELNHKKAHIQRLEKEAEHAEQTLAKWKRVAEGYTCERFGIDEKTMQTIHRYVAANRFHQAPIGPIGSYIEVKDSKWARAIQESIGRKNLAKFIVCDNHDRKVLTSICRNLSIVVMDFSHGPYTLQDTEYHSYRTVISELNVRSPVVYNLLLDLLELDMNLLFDTLHECYVVARMNLPYVRCCWSAEGKRVFIRSGGLFHTSYLSKDSILLTENFEQAQRDASTKVEDLKRQIDFSIQQAKEIQKRRTILERNMDHAVQQRKETSERMRSVENKIIEKKQELEDLRTLKDTDTLIEQRETLTNEKEEKERRMMTIEHSLRQMEKEIESLAEQERKKKHEIWQFTEECEKIRTHIEKMKSDSGRFSKEKSQLQKEYDQLDSKIEALSNEIEVEGPRLERMQEEVAEKYEPLAEWKYSSLDAVKEVAQRKAEEIKKYNERASNRTLIQITKELNDSKKRLQTVERQLHRLDDLVDRISKNVIEYGQQYIQMHKRVENTVRLYFGRFMSHRGHKGDLHIHRKSRIVSIKVAVASQRKSNGTYIPTQDLKSLSGGERSYTTLCFLMALGEALEVPFRIFDEFDVFMDEGNRHTSYQIILEEAISQTNRQFIFLTPLQLPSVKCNTNNLHFITLQPPSMFVTNLFLTQVSNFFSLGRNKWMNGQQQTLDEHEYS